MGKERNAYGNCDELRKNRKINAKSLWWRMDGERVKDVDDYMNDYF